MAKKKFNPEDWLEAGLKVEKEFKEIKEFDEIEELVRRIEERGIDLTTTYKDWLDIGFALADALGEGGRTYYHRISSFYSHYNDLETDRQFDACLKRHGIGITIKTLFYLAQQAGIEVTTAKPISKERVAKTAKADDTIPVELSTFGGELFEKLPSFLKKIIRHRISADDGAILLLGSLTVLSACLTNISGTYGGVTVFPNLFLFVTAQASAGKGRLNLCRRLAEPIHRQLRDINKGENDEYRKRLAEFSANKKDSDIEQPKEPPLRMLFIPANSSATAVFQILNDNDGNGLMFETEGDTLAQSFKSEHGNYSDGFRKAFHHEKISYVRRKDREKVELEMPRLSAVLSGTPRQIQNLIHDSENGLFSRFMFYYMNIQLQWIDVFATSKNEPLDKTFDRYGEQFFEFYNKLKANGEMVFEMTAAQQKEFNEYFSELQVEYFDICGKDYIGTVRRLGIIAFRIAMILSALSLMDSSEISKTIVCDDDNFHSSIEIIKVLVRHAACVFGMLPSSEPTETLYQQSKNALLNTLPNSFDRTKYLESAKRLGIPASTADKQIKKYIDRGLVMKSEHNQYVKIQKSNVDRKNDQGGHGDNNHL